jgi:hypothetical protein
MARHFHKSVRPANLLAPSVIRVSAIQLLADAVSLLSILPRGMSRMLATIGYERAELSDFLATLSFCGVETLVDIRDRAQSRRPGFSKSSLSSALAEVGINYIHLPALGDPKEGREAARRGDFTKFLSIFSAVMTTEVAKEALTNLKFIASTQNICLMCFERDQNECHRKIVADHLERALDKKAQHLGVKKGAGKGHEFRRVHNSDQSPAPSIEQVL